MTAVQTKPTAPTKTKRTVPWWRYLLVVLLLGGPTLLVGGALMTSESHKSEAAACQKMRTATGSIDDQYLDAIHAAPNGSAVQDALYGVYGYAGKGKLVPDATWARLSAACSAAGVNI